MEYPRQVTTLQAAAVIISTIIGVGVLPLPLFAVRSADTGAPLDTLLAILLASFGLWLITKLGVRFPRQCIIEYSENIIGKWPAWIFSILIILFFSVLTSLAAREFGEVVITSVLKKTLPVILGPVILIVALSLKNADWIYLQPVWGNEPKGMLGGLLTIAALFQGYFVHTIVIPSMRRPEKAMKASFWGMFIAAGLYFSIVVAAVGVFGPEETKNLLWPTLELAKTTTLPGNILERLDAAFLAVWVTAVFTTLFSSYYFTIHSISKLFRLKDHKLLTFFVLPYLFVMAMLPQNILQMYQVIETIGRSGLVLTIVYPLLLLAAATLRKKRGIPLEANKPNPKHS